MMRVYHQDNFAFEFFKARPQIFKMKLFSGVRLKDMIDTISDKSVYALFGSGVFPPPIRVESADWSLALRSKLHVKYASGHRGMIEVGMNEVRTWHAFYLNGISVEDVGRLADVEDADGRVGGVDTRPRLAYDADAGGVNAGDLTFGIGVDNAFDPDARTVTLGQWHALVTLRDQKALDATRPQDADARVCVYPHQVRARCAVPAPHLDRRRRQGRAHRARDGMHYQADGRHTACL